jgi:hypothetical protein
MGIESATRGSVCNWEPFAFLALASDGRQFAAERLILCNGDQVYMDENGTIRVMMIKKLE